MLVIAGNFICTVHITAVYSSIRGAKASEFHSQCVCYGEGEDDSFRI